MTQLSHGWTDDAGDAVEFTTEVPLDAIGYEGFMFRVVWPLKNGAGAGQMEVYGNREDARGLYDWLGHLLAQSEGR